MSCISLCGLLLLGSCHGPATRETNPPVFEAAPATSGPATSASATSLTAAAQVLPSKPAPLKLADLQPVLDRLFSRQAVGGMLSPKEGGGVAIGVLDHGERRIFAYGAAQPDSIFEIGSVTKTFTGLTLAQMVEQKQVTLDQPVRTLLGSPALPKPSGPEITLVDLATQHSGLPRAPDNMHPQHPADPYADYSPEDLLNYLKQHGLGRPEKPEFVYSNLGFGLLGYALAARAHMPYDELLRTEVTRPLGLADTVITLSPSQQKRLIQGHAGNNDKAQPWNMSALAGAGALKSTAADLLRYCEAHLHPERLAVHRAASTAAASLPAAIALDHELRAEVPGGAKIALAWFFDPHTGTYFHNGGTGGYTARVTFEPGRDRAIVVLYNREDDYQVGSQAVDHIAGKIAALLNGDPVPPPSRPPR